MRIYTYSTCKKIGATQQERLGQRIRQLKLQDRITYKVIAMHGDDEIGYVEGDFTDDMRTLLKFVFNEYNVLKFDNIEQFYGACYTNFHERQDPITQEVTTFETYMGNNGFTVDTNTYLEYVKAFKHFLLKSDVRVQLNDYGDSIADIFKIMMLKFYWYGSLSAEDKTAVDNQFETLSTIYSADSCKSALASMSNNTSILQAYYTTRQNLNAANEYSTIMNF